VVGTNDFLEFADGGGANVIDQATYAGLAARTDGFSAGIAESNQLNKVWRQAAAISRAIGQIVADSGGNALDDGNAVALLAAVKKAIATPPTFTVISATGTYTPPAGCVALHFEMIGGGGGGGGLTTAGLDGGATVIDGTTCAGGHGGAVNLTAGLGGSGGGGSSYFDQTGSTGQDGFLPVTGSSHGGAGAASFFGDGGTSAINVTGGAGVGFGSGGGGAGGGAVNGCGGGGAGEYRRKMVTSVAVNYAATIGGGGTGGTGANAGGTGGPGRIIVTEYYG
jgi:hypothetical protein